MHTFLWLVVAIAFAACVFEVARARGRAVRRRRMEEGDRG